GQIHQLGRTHRLHHLGRDEKYPTANDCPYHHRRGMADAQVAREFTTQGWAHGLCWRRHGRWSSIREKCGSQRKAAEFAEPSEHVSAASAEVRRLLSDFKILARSSLPQGWPHSPRQMSPRCRSRPTKSR